MSCLAETPFAIWCDPDAGTVASLFADPAAVGALDLLVARVRPAALEVARILDHGETAELVGDALDAERRPVSNLDCLANDLLALALLMEGMRGDATAQLVVDHLRRRRQK